VEDGVSGRIVEPTADAVAGALAGLMGDVSLATAMGGRARARVASLTWPATVARLLETGAASRG
jgi:glycosyltransferase involved in cell wall biosynthesis